MKTKNSLKTKTILAKKNFKTLLNILTFIDHVF